MLTYIKQRRSQRWLVHLKALQMVLEIKQSFIIHKVYAGTLKTSACTFVTVATMPSEGSLCKVVSSSVSLFITFLLYWLTKVWSGQVSTLAHKGLLSFPSGIAMHYRTNTFFVTNNRSHSVCKIIASGNKPIFSLLLLLLFLLLSSSFFFFLLLSSSFFFFLLLLLLLLTYCLRIDECSCWEWRTRESGWTWNECSFKLSLRHSNWSTDRHHIRFQLAFNSKDDSPRYEHVMLPRMVK